MVSEERKHTAFHSHHRTKSDISEKNLLVVVVLNFTITAAEIIGGILSNSLALLSDALHNLGDGIAVLVAYIANRISKKDSNQRKTFGYQRIEILAAFINAVFLVAICIFLIVEAIKRFQDPEPIKGLIMFIVAGIGLAAIQVGIDRSLLIYDISPQDEDRCMKVLVNPRIIESQGEVLSENEGCLSVPEYRSNVKRFASILVEAYDRNEKLLRFEAHEFLSIVLQHEIDHLNGKLFIDRISPLKRQLYARRVQKQLKQRG